MNMLPFTNAPRSPDMGLTCTRGSSGTVPRDRSASAGVGLWICIAVSDRWDASTRALVSRPQSSSRRHRNDTLGRRPGWAADLPGSDGTSRLSSNGTRAVRRTTEVFKRPSREMRGTPGTPKRCGGLGRRPSGLAAPFDEVGEPGASHSQVQIGEAQIAIFTAGEGAVRVQPLEVELDLRGDRSLARQAATKSAQPRRNGGVAGRGSDYAGSGEHGELANQVNVQKANQVNVGASRGSCWSPRRALSARDHQMWWWGVLHP